MRAPPGWIRRLWPFVAAHRRDTAVAFGAAVAGLTAAALTPLVQKVVIDDVILARRRPLAPWLAQLVSRAISDVGLVQGLLAFLPLFSGNVVLLVLSLVVMTVLSPLLTLVTLVVVPAILVVALRLRTTVFPAAWDAQQRAGEVAGVVDEAVSGVRVVKGFGQEDRELARLADAARDL